jgi:hypothetical protein
VQERKGGSESSILHPADLTQYGLRKSSSGSHLTVTVNCRDVSITPYTYLCAGEEGRKGGSESSVLYTADITQFLFEKYKFLITCKSKC